MQGGEGVADEEADPVLRQSPTGTSSAQVCLSSSVEGVADEEAAPVQMQWTTGNHGGPGVLYRRRRRGKPVQKWMGKATGGGGSEPSKREGARDMAGAQVGLPKMPLLDNVT